MLLAPRKALDAGGVTTDDLSPPLDPAGALDLAWRLVDAEITPRLGQAQVAGSRPRPCGGQE
ncbi:MAG: hypothetical protein ACRDY0_12695 [Acidimicrobiales bacterium]